MKNISFILMFSWSFVFFAPPCETDEFLESYEFIASAQPSVASIRKLIENKEAKFFCIFEDANEEGFFPLNVVLNYIGCPDDEEIKKLKEPLFLEFKKMDHKDGYECVETRKLSLALLKEEESLSINPFKAGLSFNCEKSFIPTQGGFLPVLCFYIAEIQVYLLSCDEETKELSLCLAEDYYDNQGRSVFSTSSIVRDLWSWSTDLTIKAFCLFNRSAINTVDGVHFVWTSYVNPPPRGWFKRPH